MSDVQDEQPDHDALSASASVDPAAAAFEALREEVALARRAVAGLAAERASIDIPDYGETLGRIFQATVAMTRQLKAFAESPALRLAPREWAHEIATAAENARRSDHQALECVQVSFERQAQEIAASLESAKTAAKQRQLLFWTAVSAALIGAFLSAIIFGVIV